MTIAATIATLRRPRHGLSPVLRAIVAGGSVLLLLIVGIAFTRFLIGVTPPTPYIENPALIVHLATAIPAIPLGAWVLLTRKGGERHKLLGKVWLALMFVTAFSTLWLRGINGGSFSFIHALTLLTFIAVPKAIVTARRGDIVAHRQHLQGFFIGALLLAGLSAFAPGRVLWQWLLG